VIPSDENQILAQRFIEHLATCSPCSEMWNSFYGSGGIFSLMDICLIRHESPECIALFAAVIKAFMDDGGEIASNFIPNLN